VQRREGVLLLLQEAPEQENLLQDATQPRKAQLKAQLERAQQSVISEVQNHLAKAQEREGAQADLSERREAQASGLEERGIWTRLQEEGKTLERRDLRREAETEALKAVPGILMDKLQKQGPWHAIEWERMLL
jgi:hypothetical protein